MHSSSNGTTASSRKSFPALYLRSCSRDEAQYHTAEQKRSSDSSLRPHTTIDITSGACNVSYTLQVGSEDGPSLPSIVITRGTSSIVKHMLLTLGPAPLALPKQPGIIPTTSNLRKSSRKLVIIASVPMLPVEQTYPKVIPGTTKSTTTRCTFLPFLQATASQPARHSLSPANPPQGQVHAQSSSGSPSWHRKGTSSNLGFVC